MLPFQSCHAVSYLGSKHSSKASGCLTPSSSLPTPSKLIARQLRENSYWKCPNLPSKFHPCHTWMVRTSSHKASTLRPRLLLVSNSFRLNGSKGEAALEASRTGLLQKKSNRGPVVRVDVCLPRLARRAACNVAAFRLLLSQCANLRATFGRDEGCSPCGQVACLPSALAVRREGA